MATARYESGPGDPAWEKRSQEMTRFALDDQRSPFAVDAELELVRDTAMKDGRIDHYTHVAKIAQQLYNSGQIHLRANVRDALEVARAAVGEYDANGIAAERLIISKALETDLDAANLDDLIATILHLGQNKSLPRSASDLQQERQAVATAQEEFERGTLIRSITRGKPAFPLWSPIHGKAMSVSSGSLQHESTQRLKEIADSVERYRALRDGRPVVPVAEQVDEGIVATITAQKKTTGYMGSDAQDEFLAHPDHPEREYTQKEIKQNLRQLLFIHGQSRGQARVNAINRVLRGEQYNGPRP
jgi:hypothetical protein